MLHNIEFGCNEIKPEKLAKSKLIKAFERSVPKVTWDKVIRIIDEAIENIVKGSGQLTWCCTGSMLGNDSVNPHGDINYLWNKISGIMGQDRLCNMTIGTLVQWRISLRNEDWWCNRVDTEDTDKLTGDKIYYYQYWIKI